MVEIIRGFGFLSILVSVILILVAFSFNNIILLPAFLSLGATALLNGAMLIAFARMVELLEELNGKMTPVYAIAKALEEKHHPANVVDRESDSEVKYQTGVFDRNSNSFDNLPVGSNTNGPGF